MDELEIFNKIKIGIASDEKIREWSKGGELGVCGRVWECGKPNGFSIISIPWSEGEKGR